MEAARILIGLTVAVLFPDSLPVVRRSFLFRAAFAGLYGLWVLAPLLPWWQVLALTLLAVFWSCSLRVWEKIVSARPAAGGAPNRVFGIRIYLGRIVKRVRREMTFTTAWLGRMKNSRHRRSAASALVLGILTILLLDLSINFDFSLDEILDTAGDRKFIIVVSGFLAATFVSHEIVARIYSRFDADAPKTRIEIFAFGETYAYIGWFERALVFAFVAGGQAAAAALVIAAKSLARHPEIEKDRKFGERFIIGTFLSVLFGVFWAVIVRVALNLRPM